MTICIKYYLSQNVPTFSFLHILYSKVIEMSMLKSYCFDFVIEKVPVQSLFKAQNGDFFSFFYQLA